MTTKHSVYWSGDPGEKDDFGFPIKDEFIDGKTQMGPWANMAPSTFKIHGIGLGQGYGQRYKKQADGRWLKIEG